MTSRSKLLIAVAGCVSVAALMAGLRPGNPAALPGPGRPTGAPLEENAPLPTVEPSAGERACAAVEAPQPPAPLAHQPGPAVFRTEITGRVVDEGGESLEGVQVSLELVLGSRAEDSRPRLRASTDREGVFRFPGVEATGWSARLGLDSARLGRRELFVDGLEGGGTTDLGHLVLRAPGRISGRVVDGFGRGVAARVAWRPAGSGRESGIQETNTDARGRFMIGPLQPGRVELVALGETFAGPWGPALPVRSDEVVDEVVLELVPFEGSAGEDEDVPEPRLAAEKLLLLDRVTGEPIAAAQIGMPPPSVYPLPVPHVRVLARTDAAGRAALAGGWPRRAHALAAGYRRRSLSTGEIEGDQLVVSMDPAGDLRLEVLAAGSPAEAATVELRLALGNRARSPGTNLAFPLLATGVTDAQGVCLLEAVLPSKVPDLLILARSADGASVAMRRVDHCRARELSVQLEPWARVHGRLVDADGTPVAPGLTHVALSHVVGAHVVRAHTPTGLELTARVDAEGRFDLRLPAGRARLTVDTSPRVRPADVAAHRGWMSRATGTAPLAVELRAGELRDLALPALPTPGSLRGVLNFPSGPVAFAEVGCVPLDLPPGVVWERARVVATDARGRFEVEALPAGRWDLRFARRFGSSSIVVCEAEVEVHPGLVTDVGLQPVTGRLRLRAPAMTLRGASLYRAEDPQRSLGALPFSEAGEFELELEAGTYGVCAWNTLQGTFEVSEGQTLVHETGSFVHGCGD